jgi:hypothetical protein
MGIEANSAGRLEQAVMLNGIGSAHGSPAANQKLTEQAQPGHNGNQTTSLVG